MGRGVYHPEVLLSKILIPELGKRGLLTRLLQVPPVHCVAPKAKYPQAGGRSRTAGGLPKLSGFPVPDAPEVGAGQQLPAPVSVPVDDLDLGAPPTFAVDVREHGVAVAVDAAVERPLQAAPVMTCGGVGLVVCSGFPPCRPHPFRHRENGAPCRVSSSAGSPPLRDLPGRQGQYRPIPASNCIDRWFAILDRTSASIRAMAKAVMGRFTWAIVTPPFRTRRLVQVCWPPC